MSRILASGSMTKTARTAWVLLWPGWIMPYLLATSMRMSSMSGNLTSTFSMPFQLSSWILRSQAMCE